MLTTGGWETDLPLLVCVHTVCVCRCCQEILPVSNVPNPGPLAPPCPSPSTQASSLRSLQGGGSREWMGGGSAPYCCPTGDSSAPSTSVRHLCDRRGSVCPTVPPHPCHRLGVEARTQGPWARSPLVSGSTWRFWPQGPWSSPPSSASHCALSAEMCLFLQVPESSLCYFKSR